MGAVAEIEEMLDSYEIYVTEGLDDDDDYESEALLALIERDAIEKRWDEMNKEQRERVGCLDEVLASKHQRVAEVLPNKCSDDPERWWWRLHMGPQVRGQALSTKRE